MGAWLPAKARDLIVGEGMGHCYLYDSNPPEARDAYGVIVRFLRTHLHSPCAKQIGSLAN